MTQAEILAILTNLEKILPAAIAVVSAPTLTTEEALASAILTALGQTTIEADLTNVWNWLQAFKWPVVTVNPDETLNG